MYDGGRKNPQEGKEPGKNLKGRFVVILELLLALSLHTAVYLFKILNKAKMVADTHMLNAVLNRDGWSWDLHDQEFSITSRPSLSASSSTSTNPGTIITTKCTIRGTLIIHSNVTLPSGFVFTRQCSRDGIGIGYSTRTSNSTHTNTNTNTGTCTGMGTGVGADVSGCSIRATRAAVVSALDHCLIMFGIDMQAEMVIKQSQSHTQIPRALEPKHVYGQTSKRNSKEMQEQQERLMIVHPNQYKEFKEANSADHQAHAYAHLQPYPLPPSHPQQRYGTGTGTGVCPSSSGSVESAGSTGSRPSTATGTATATSTGISASTSTSTSTTNDRSKGIPPVMPTTKTSGLVGRGDGSTATVSSSSSSSSSSFSSSSSSSSSSSTATAMATDTTISSTGTDTIVLGAEQQKLTSSTATASAAAAADTVVAHAAGYSTGSVLLTQTQTQESSEEVRGVNDYKSATISFRVGPSYPPTYEYLKAPPSSLYAAAATATVPTPPVTTFPGSRRNAPPPSASASASASVSASASDLDASPLSFTSASTLCSGGTNKGVNQNQQNQQNQQSKQSSSLLQTAGETNTYSAMTKRQRQGPGQEQVQGQGQ